MTDASDWLRGKAGVSFSGVTSALTLRTDRESSLSVVEETAPEPYPLKATKLVLESQSSPSFQTNTLEKKGMKVERRKEEMRKR